MPRRKTKRRRTVKNSRKKPARFARVVPTDKKVKVIVKNLILFGVLFVLSLLLYNVFTDEILSNFFWILALLTGFIVVALVITYLVFFFLRVFKK